MSDAEGYQAIAEAELEAASHRPPERTLGQKLRLPLMVGAPALALLAVGYFVLTGGRFETTDNAYVQTARTAISPSIDGRVVEVDVRENQKVRKGDVLFKLDPADYQVAVAQAEAALAAARFDVESSQGVYAQRQADLAAAQERVAYTEREAVRQKGLAAAGVSPQAQADQAAHEAEQARRQVAVVRQQMASALADIGGRAASPDQHPKVLQAQAQLDRARLNLSYTTIVAPADGVVAKVEQIQVGNRVATAQPLFWLISGAPWIEANFKEDQLAHMRIGQPATVKIDAYDHELKAHVASFSPGTGSSFALLPAENATGNWVKVVQRLPVRLALDEAAPDLSGGLSATAKVDVRSALKK
ncbi:HlyD family secretion protein [Phenylobacterium sp.]|uniref:HlyD family secretion protein n=1 Tax=Phenylobacterium sp. TaxID=1871053 RepID=UPI0028A02E52|nr:HlyD family secretion protein [Phenylobacterium sp.]